MIIPTFQGAAELQACLESVRRFAPEAEVIVADNASTDRSVSIACAFDGVRVLEGSENAGFGAACNRGAAAAVAPVLLFLNQDARLDGPIDQAIRELQADAELGVLGARVRYEDGRSQPSLGRSLSAARVLMEWLGYPLRVAGMAAGSSLMRRADEIYSQPTAGDWISGSSLFMRADLFGELGGFSADYFMYVEDADLCARARARGKQVRLCPQVEVIHSERSGAVGISAFSMVHTLRGQARYITRFSGPVRARLVMAALLPLFAALALAGRLLAWLGGGQHARANGRAFGCGLREALRLSFGRRLDAGGCR